MQKSKKKMRVCRDQYEMIGKFSKLSQIEEKLTLWQHFHLEGREARIVHEARLDLVKLNTKSLVFRPLKQEAPFSFLPKYPVYAKTNFYDMVFRCENMVCSKYFLGLGLPEELHLVEERKEERWDQTWESTYPVYFKYLDQKSSLTAEAKVISLSPQGIGILLEDPFSLEIGERCSIETLDDRTFLSPLKVEVCNLARYKNPDVPFPLRQQVSRIGMKIIGSGLFPRPS